MEAKADTGGEEGADGGGMVQRVGGTGAAGEERLTSVFLKS